MARISTFCVLSGALAVLALSADSAGAGTLTIHTPTTTPKVNVQTPKLVNPGTTVRGANKNVGIFKLTPEKVEGGSENIKRTYTTCPGCVLSPR